MRWAVEANYDYLWVMDDDCFPKTDALEKLLSADSLLKGVYGWMSSVALWTDGRECRMNRPKVKKSFYEHIELLREGVLQAEQATFVSLFLKSETVREVGLPMPNISSGEMTSSTPGESLYEEIILVISLGKAK